MEKLIEILEDIRPDVDFDNADNLIESGSLDSFDIALLVENISEKYGVEIKVEDIVPSNFSSVETIKNLIDSYL